MFKLDWQWFVGDSHFIYFDRRSLIRVPIQREMERLNFLKFNFIFYYYLKFILISILIVKQICLGIDHFDFYSNLF